MGIFEVCGNVGGIQQVFFVVSAFFLCQYSDIGFKTEAFNEFFNIKTEDESLLEDNKLKVTQCDKFKLLTCCANKKKKRFFENGDTKLDTELDIVHIIKLLNKLEKLVHDPSEVNKVLDLNLDESEDED